MTRFIGGPYDGREFEVSPMDTTEIRMPCRRSIAAGVVGEMIALGYRGSKVAPHLYVADLASDSAVYRFVEERHRTTTTQVRQSA